MTEPRHIRFETPREAIARVVLARPETRNAQDTQFLYELNDAFDRAVQDDAIKVIILSADGPHFSSGHDLREGDGFDNQSKYRAVGTWGPPTGDGAAPMLAREQEIYLGFSERWRNLSKPTIAQVHGKCIAGGLMLCWPCDLIVASDTAEFQDPTLLMGIAGVEFFAHPWELGPRKAKEMLFTADVLTAAEAHRLGMVNHVVAEAELEAFTLDLAARIAAKPMFALRLAKWAVNAAEDAQGRREAMQTAFALHHLAHSHHMQAFGMPIDPGFVRPGAGKSG